MKEKISCSLDGNLVEIMDRIISQRPLVKTRSALIEMSLMLTFSALFTSIDNENHVAGFNDDLLTELYERRCELNAQKENEN